MWMFAPLLSLLSFRIAPTVTLYLAAMPISVSPALTL